VTAVYLQAHLSDFSIVPSRSGVMRTWDQRIILDVRFADYLSLKASYLSTAP